MLDRFNTMVLDLYSRIELWREEGQGTVEYALVLAIVVGVVATAVGLLGSRIGAKIDGITP